jgi:hypothetical protein
VIAAALALLLRFASAGEGAAPDAFAVAARVATVRADSLWPGFDPAAMPLAIFDGRRTYLFRHPSPPAEFEPVSGRPDARSVAGRHALVRANTSVVLGGVPTATVLLDAADVRPTITLASLAIHEMFHVFQGARHPKWGGNEVDLFTYPIDDAGLLHLARVEEETLRRALGAKRARDAACWAAAALDARQRRFASLGETHTAYERGTELKEGLAQLVERRALGEKADASILPAARFGAGEVRSRSYAVGEAYGALLDRLDPGWEKRLERVEQRLESGVQPLDALLSESLASRKPRRCELSRAELDQSLADARRSVELAGLTRDAIRRDFLGKEGWRVVVVAAAAEPLFPQNFDPLNVERLAPGEVLHMRWVKLGNASGSIEVIDRRALTESAGKHPLFEGVRRVTIPGVASEPEVRESSEGISIRAAGVNVDFRGARASRDGRVITVTLSR